LRLLSAFCRLNAYDQLIQMSKLIANDSISNGMYSLKVLHIEKNRVKGIIEKLDDKFRNKTCLQPYGAMYWSIFGWQLTTQKSDTLIRYWWISSRNGK